MIDTFQAKTKSKKLVLIINGLTVMIGEYRGKGKKPTLIDIAFGDSNQIVDDLRRQGYELKIIEK